MSRPSKISSNRTALGVLEPGGESQDVQVPVGPQALAQHVERLAWIDVAGLARESGQERLLPFGAVGVGDGGVVVLAEEVERPRAGDGVRARRERHPGRGIPRRLPQAHRHAADRGGELAERVHVQRHVVVDARAGERRDVLAHAVGAERSVHLVQVVRGAVPSRHAFGQRDHRGGAVGVEVREHEQLGLLRPVQPHEQHVLVPLAGRRRGAVEQRRDRHGGQRHGDDRGRHGDQGGVAAPWRAGAGELGQDRAGVGRLVGLGGERLPDQLLGSVGHARASFRELDSSVRRVASARETWLRTVPGVQPRTSAISASVQSS